MTASKHVEDSEIRIASIVFCALAIIASFAVCFEIVVFHSLRQNQVKRITLGLMVTNIVLAAALMARECIVVGGDYGHGNDRLRGICFSDSLSASSIVLNGLFEIFLLVCCVYSVFGQAIRRNLPLPWEGAGYLLCSLLFLPVLIAMQVGCMKNCSDASHVLDSATGECDDMFSELDMATLSIVVVVVVLWVLIHRKLRRIRAQWAAPDFSECSKVERVNRERLIELHKEALQSGYQPYAWFQWLFVLFCIAEVMVVIGRQREIAPLVAFGNLTHTIRMVLQALSYFTLPEHRQVLNLKTVQKRIARLKRLSQVRHSMDLDLTTHLNSNHNNEEFEDNNNDHNNAHNNNANLQRVPSGVRFSSELQVRLLEPPKDDESVRSAVTSV